ncbi:MAG TPA: thioredoxin family protein [Thermoanaerobaculia bacterium]|nr:thioredoxin family protein [Thermoanaerobaculia bacterium]
MKKQKRSWLAVLVLAAACTANGQAVQEEKATANEEKGVLVGAVTREQVEAAAPEWVQAEVESQPGAEAARALTGVEPGAEVTVFLGTWCGDSRRELSRLWRALDQIGTAGGTLPFQIRYIAVDREKKQPADLVAENDIHYVPTLIVRRGGRELGRIVETSPNGVEQDLLALLTGKTQGTVSASQPPEGAPETSR